MWHTAMSGARQRFVAHGKEVAHGSLPAARQRSGARSDGSARQRWQRTAKGFTVQSLHAYDKDGFAIENVVVQSLP
jgi:hypothetical protein